jgi:hypothetical protein
MNCPEHGKPAKQMAPNRWWCSKCCGMMFHRTKKGLMMGNGHGHYWVPRKLDERSPRV